MKRNIRTMLILSIFLISSVIISWAGGSILSLSEMDSDELRVYVDVDNEGCYVGCSFYTPSGRVDMYPEYIVGKDIVFFSIPDDAFKAEVALWRNKYKYGAGPDPYNGWAKENGYYLWNELDRDRINLSR